MNIYLSIQQQQTPTKMDNSKKYMVVSGRGVNVCKSQAGAGKMWRKLEREAKRMYGPQAGQDCQLVTYDGREYVGLGLIISSAGETIEVGAQRAVDTAKRHIEGA